MLVMTKCWIPLTIPGDKIRENIHIEAGGCYASGGGATVNKTVNVYINKLIISGNPGNYDIQYTPTLLQRIKSVFKLQPPKAVIETAIRRDLLGENK